MEKIKLITDNLSTKDGITISKASPGFRTQIIAGYDHFVDEMGHSRFGEVVFEEENMTLIGGSIFTLEKLFGVRMNPNIMAVSQLSDVFASDGINGPDVWSRASTDNLPAENVVCLFGVGIGGAGNSIGNVKDVKYYQRTLDSMVPLRMVTDDSELSISEHSKYFCRSESDGLVSYYLKKFDNVEIKCKWRDSDDEGEGSNVTSDYYNTSDTVTTPMETFVELTLKITKDDIREYFEIENNGENVELARVNTVGLFTGISKNLETPIPVEYDTSIGTTEPYYRTTDYDQVTCFSALNFDNIMLSLPKELTIIYRIFTK